MHVCVARCVVCMCVYCVCVDKTDGGGGGGAVWMCAFVEMSKGCMDIGMPVKG